VSRPMNRRQFLYSTGRLAIALPFLESLAPQMAFGQAMSPAKRFVAVMAPNGYHEPVYYPSVAADQKFSEHIFTKQLTSIQGPLSESFGTSFDALRPKMNILRGLDIAGAFGHTPISGLCSARRITNGDNAPIDPVGNSRSLDVVLSASKSFYQTQPRFKALRGIESGGTPMSIDRDSSGKTIQIPYTLWPYDMFQQVFAGSGITPNEAAALASKKATIGDLVLNSYKTLMNNKRISTSDKTVVSNFVGQLQELNQKVVATPLSCSTPSIAKASSDYYGLLPESEQLALAHQFIDIMITAMSCDLTRICILSLGNDNYRHGVSHENYLDRESQLRFNGILQKYQAPIVKAFATKMDAIQESNGKSMLDNSVLFWGMEQSAGNAHCAVSMPAVTFGSMGGAIRTGYYVDYRQRDLKYYAGRSDIFPGFGSETYNQLMNTFFRGFGLSPTDYEQYGDGGGFGSFDTNSVMEYLRGEYDSLRAKRKNTLPFISLV
jgi:Protein of unknown function (DUF1552)